MSIMYMKPNPADPRDKIHYLFGDVLRTESDHRIANNLALIVGLMRMRARAVAQKPGPMDREEVRLLLDDVACRIDTVARLHRMLSRPSRQVFGNLAHYLREICESLISSLAPSGGVIFSQDVDLSCGLPPDQALSLGLLISELMTNSVKYAHPTGVPTKIKIACSHAEDGGLLVDYADDGIGLPENFDPMVDGGLGLRLVRSLGEQLGASIRFDHDELGTRFRLEMRVAMADAAE
jgi:two-component sensor histidine kinase